MVRYGTLTHPTIDLEHECTLLQSTRRFTFMRLDKAEAESLFSKRSLNKVDLGFTLIETMIAVVIIGVLAAIAAPSWIAFVDTRRLNFASDEIYRALLEAQSNAKRDKITWQVSLQEKDGSVQWAVHPANPNQFIPTGVSWKNLDSNIQIYKDKNDLNQCETTLTQPAASCPANGPWRVQFDYQGIPKREGSELGRITLNATTNNSVQRCVYIATILGTIRTGQEQSTANSNDKYCY